ncbi:MAG: hypothetical protein WAN35_05505 [Terracidiphilus sp.]
MKTISAFVTFTLFSTMTVAAYSQQLFDSNQTVQQTVAGERDCIKEDRQFIELAKTSGLLKSGYIPSQTCRSVAFPWLPSARIVQITGVQQRDVFVSITVVRASETSPLRLVTALGGLVENRDRENDETNKSAFNELLQTLAQKMTDNQMMDIGVLYLFMVGHPPDESPKMMEEILSSNDSISYIERKNGWITVTLHQRKSLPLGNSRSAWKLRFHSGHNQLKLISVIPE